jgi:SpoVK/Ycf46/Vps4 family AAA+-type ATPase
MSKKDPIKINNFNKFLSTLDQTCIDSKIYSPESKNINLDEDIKETIDRLIKNLSEDFEKNKLSSSILTGQTSSDILIANMNIQNPNDYNIQKEPFYLNSTKRHFDKNSIKIEIPESKINIHIDTEINDISDILKLIETYHLDPSIKYNINMKALHNIKEHLEELNNMIGMKDLKNNIVEQILYFIQELHKNKDSLGDFMHSVIYGPPGTGKTEIAKIMGKIYSKLGVLSKGTFKKVTRSDLISGYLGQTALKTRDVIKESIGGVLFIDEAYALGNAEKRDSFAKECIDTLCEALSDNKGDLMVIIAGYENELKECFFDYNQGLNSRFVWRFKTDEYNYEDLYNIFIKKVKEIGWNIHENAGIKNEWFKKNIEYFKYYGRDIETILAKTKIAHSKRVFCKPENEKRNIILKDLENGFQIYLKNDDIKNRKNELETKKYLYNTLYS